MMRVSINQRNDAMNINEEGALMAPEAPETQEPPSRVNRALESARYVVTNTLMTGMKGALIGGLALATGAAVFGLPALGLSALTGGAIFSGTMGGMVGTGLVYGALAGGAAGAAIGMVSGISNAEEAVDMKEDELASKETRRQQLAARQEMMKMNMERMRGSQYASSMVAPSHGLGGITGKSEGYELNV
jgi:outer membrane murein-binding lipoprotein Lpp